MGILLFILFGAIVGWIADYFDSSVHLGWIERILVGIVGSLVGGTLYNLITTGSFDLTTADGFNIGSILLSVVGALLTLFVWKRVAHRRAV